MDAYECWYAEDVLLCREDGRMCGGKEREEGQEGARRTANAKGRKEDCGGRASGEGQCGVDVSRGRAEVANSGTTRARHRNRMANTTTMDGREPLMMIAILG